MILWMIAGLLLASCFLLVPLLRVNPIEDAPPSDSVVQANVALFHEQLARLKQQFSNDEIDVELFQQLEAELQQQLLLDAPQPVVGRSVKRFFSGKALLFACMLILPLAAVGLYSKIGSAKAVKISQLLTQINQTELAESQTIRTELLRRLIQQLEREPDNAAYLVSTARLLLEEQKFLLSVNYYQRAVAIVPQQSAILAEYAQASYFASANQITPVVESALQRSLAIDPSNATALGLQGIAHYGVGEYLQAVESWQRALQKIPPNTAQAQALMAGIERGKLALNNSGQSPDELEQPPAKTVVVHLSLDGQLQASSDQVIYLFAKEFNGGPMPLAVSRLRVADLPALITLDDAMAMPGGKKLSSAQEIYLVARVSSSGTVNVQPGDLQGESGKILLNQGAKEVQLNIDTQL